MGSHDMAQQAANLLQVASAAGRANPWCLLVGDNHAASPVYGNVFSEYGHGFNNDYWHDGWGFDDPCNVRKPVARVLNAMWLLGYSAEDYENEEWSSRC